MKHFSLIVTLVLLQQFASANYTGTITTNQNELTFSTKGGYDFIAFQSPVCLNQIGAPQLPAKIIRVLMPIDQKVSSIVINSTTVQQLTGTYNIYPAQRPLLTKPNPNPQAHDSLNQIIYSSMNPYPGMTYQVTDDGYPRAYHVVTIEFFPVQYIPASKTLNLYTSINFTIVYASNSESILRPEQQSTYSTNLSKEIIQKMVVNPSDINIVTGGVLHATSSNNSASQNKKGMAVMGMSPTSLTNLPDYIIITRSDLASSFQKLANWKTQKGINTIIVKTSDIYSNYPGVDHPEMIRNYLKDAYKNFGSVYVLLGGDINDNNGAELVPSRVAYIKTETIQPDLHVTNYYYATVNGNWNANGDNVFAENGFNAALNYANDNADYSMAFLVGRAPVHTTKEANNFCNKIITYENLKDTTGTALATPSYVKKLTFWVNNCSNGAICGDNNDFGFFYNITPDLHTMASSLLSGYTIDSLYYSLSGANQLTQANAISSINNDNHIIYHLDHGGPNTMMTSSGINQSVGLNQFDALTNGNYYGILYSDGCNTNDFAQNSISKHFVNNDPAGSNQGGYTNGGVAFLGNVDFGEVSDYSYFIDYFMDTLYNNSYHNSQYHIGYLNYQSAYLIPLVSSDWNKNSYLKNRNLIGDPEMMVWSNTPITTLALSGMNYTSSTQTFTVSVSGLSFTATPKVEVLVTIWKGTEIWATKDTITTHASNTITFSKVEANTTGNITVTATAHNYIPAVGTYSVTTISGAHPYMTSNTILDNGTKGTHGNGDVQADAGETIGYVVTLTNSGSTTATSVTATLGWTNGSNPTNSTIISSTTIPNINAGSTANDTFLIKIDTSAFAGLSPRPLTKYLNMTLTINANGGLVETTPVLLEITEPNLIKGENLITGHPTALGISSTDTLRVKLYNIGLSQVVGLKGTLTKNTDPSGNITITSGASKRYGAINGVNNGTNYATNTSTFNFTIGGIAVYNSNETFNLSVVDTFGRKWNFNNFELSQPRDSFKVSSEGQTSSINIFWTDTIKPTSTHDTIVGYNLYRSRDSAGICVGTYMKMNKDLIPYAEYSDTGLAPLTAYCYYLTEVDKNGDVGLPHYFTATTSLPFHSAGEWPSALDNSDFNITDFRGNGSPNVYDLMGDGDKEIFFTTGFNGIGGEWAFSQDGTRWYSFDGDITHISGYINFNCASNSTPAIADINNDGIPDMGVITQVGSGSVGAIPNSLMIYETPDQTGVAPTPLSGFPKSIVSGGYNTTMGAVYSDLYYSGTMDVLTTDQSSDGLQVFTSSGTVPAGSTWRTGYNCGFTMPVAFDFQNNRKKEIVVGCTGSGGTYNAGLYIFNNDGSDFSTNPVYTPSSGYRCDFPPVVADINNDGNYDIVFVSASGTTAKIYAYTPGTGTYVTGWSPLTGTAPTFTLSATVSNNTAANDAFGLDGPALSIGDLNKDGILEVIGGNNGSLYIWEGNTGTSTPYKTISISGYLSSSANGSVYMAPIIADIDNVNTDLEIIVTGANGIGSNIYAYKMNGNSVGGFPIYIPDGTGSGVMNTPCVDDINFKEETLGSLPSLNELIVTNGVNFYVWDSQGADSNNVYGWTSYRHDNLNSGVWYNMAGAYPNDGNLYLQDMSAGNTGNLYRYYSGKNISAGYDVVPTSEKANGPVVFINGSTIIMDASNTVTLKDQVTVQVGCTLTIK
jgi:hypothetical protein